MYDHLVQQKPGALRKWAELRVEALDHALRDVPEDRVRYHGASKLASAAHGRAPLEDIVTSFLQVRAGGTRWRRPTTA